MAVHSLHERRSLAQSTARRDAAHFIDGAFTQGSTGKSWQNFCPTDGSLIGSVPEGGRAEIDAAVKAGRVRLLLSSQVTRIDQHSAELSTADGPETIAADHVIVRIGGEAAYPFVERCGVRIVKKALAAEPGDDARKAS